MSVGEKWWEDASRVVEQPGSTGEKWWEDAVLVTDQEPEPEKWWEDATLVSALESEKEGPASVIEPAYLQARNQALQQAVMQQFDELAGVQEQAEPTADTRTAVQRIIDAPVEVEREMAAEQAGPEPEVEVPEEIEPLSNAVKAYRSFKVGGLGLVDLVGGAAVWAGMEESGERIREYAREGIADNYVKELYEEFSWGDMTESEFWLTKAPSMIPSMITLVPVAIGGGFAAGAVAGAAGLGALGIGISAAVGSALAARPLESAMEAMGTYNSLLDQGASEEVASEEAAAVFTKNMALAGMDAAQFALAFAKVPAPLRSGMAGWIQRNGIRAVGFGAGALSEGYEEVIQGYFQEVGQQAVDGELDVSLLESLKLASPESKESFALGTIGGLGFQTTGAIARKLTTKDATAIIQEQIDNITPEEVPSEEVEKPEVVPPVAVPATEAAPPEPAPGPKEAAPKEKQPEPVPVTAEVEPSKEKPVEAVPPKEPEIGPEKAAEEVKPPLKIGDPFRVAGTDMVVADIKRIEGVDYELYSGAKLKEKKAAFRVYDADSGNVVSLVTYPDFDAAEREFKKAIKSAAAVTEEPKPSAVEALPGEVEGVPARKLPETPPKFNEPFTVFGDKFFRETDAEGALSLLPETTRAVDLMFDRFFMSNTPELALGQGRNKGILIEFEAGDIKGKLNTSKPGWEVLYDSGQAEFTTLGTAQSQYMKAVRSFTIKPELKTTTTQSILIKNIIGRLKDKGWTKTVNTDGSTTYTRPAEAPPFAPEVEKPKPPKPLEGKPGLSPEDVKLYSVTGPIDPELVKATIREVESLAVAVKKTVERTIRRGTTHMRKLGEGGKELATDIDEIAFNVQREANNDAQDIQKIMKGLTGKDRIAVAMLTDNEISAESQSDQIIKRSEQLRKVLDRQLEEFSEVGGLRRLGGPGAKRETPIGVGHAFPQVPNKEGRQVLKEVAAGSMNPWWAMSPRVSKAVEWMVEKGLAKNADAAVQQLARFRDQQLRSVNPYFERTRNPLPSYLREWDPHKVLSGAMEKNWLTIEGIRKWGWDEAGKSFPGASELIGKISLENPYDAEIVHQFIQSSFGLGSRASEEIQRISRDLRAVQFIGKIALSPLTITRNMIDRFAKAYTTAGLSTTVRATMKFPPFVNVWIKSAARIKDQMIRSGAVFSHGSIAEGIEPATIIMKMVGLPFSASERGNQIFESLVAKMKLERDINLYLEAKPKSRLGEILRAVQSLGENTESEIAERIKEAGLDGKTTEELVNILTESKGGDLLPIEVQAVLHRASRDQAFPVILSTKRLWWDNHPFMKVLSQFKVWPIEQIGFIYRSAMAQAIRGNIAPLLRFIIGVVLAGELYNIFRDAAYEKEEALLTILRKRPDKHNLKDITWILLKDAVDGGLVGMFADLTWGLTDWVLGPTAATVGEFGKTLVSVISRPGLTVHALKRAVRRDVSMTRQAEGILNKIGVWIGRDSKRAVLYNRWRFRANEYWREQNVDVFEKIEKVIMGPPSYPVGKNSLVYDLIARAITAKDIEGAAEYIRILFDEKDTLEERKKTWAGIRQSKTRRSPLGPVALKSRRDFLGRFSDEDQQEAKGLQREWLADYNRAMIKSRKAATSSD